MESVARDTIRVAGSRPARPNTAMPDAANNAASGGGAATKTTVTVNAATSAATAVTVNRVRTSSRRCSSIRANMAAFAGSA